jgi:hypothetical protein
MKVPAYVNIEVIDEKGKFNVAAAVIDFHPSEIKRLINTYDGMTSLLTSDNMVIKVLVPFREMCKIYNIQHRIDDTFKEEVDAFFEDNYKEIKNRIKKYGTDTDTTEV